MFWKVQDVSEQQEQRENLAACSSPELGVVPKLQCLTTGLTHGNQTLARAELCALLEATKHAVSSENCQVVVDAQYVINVAHRLSSPEIPWHKVANADLVKQLKECWPQKAFTISKI